MTRRSSAPAFRVLIDSAEDLEVVGEAASGDDAVRLARSTRADVVFMDIRMPGTDGIAATQAITDDDDLAGVKVVVLTTFEIDAYVIEAVRAGASSFRSKSIEPADLLDAIRTVAGGDALLSPKATQALLAEFATAGTGPAIPADRLADLTTREREMMTLAAHGLSNDQIAERLFLSPLTVKTHINRAMMKLAVRDRAQLVVLAYQSDHRPPRRSHRLLADVVVAPAIEAAQPVELAAAPADHHERHGRIDAARHAVGGAYAADDVQARAVGQAEVDEGDVGELRLQQAQAVAGAVGHEQLVAVGGEVVGQEGARRRVVLDEQDGGGGVGGAHGGH